MAIMAGYIPPEQQWGQTGQQMMDGSFVDEVQKQQQNLIDSARAEAIKQDPTLSYVQRQIAKGLLGAKQDWEAAYNAGDAAGMANAALQGRSLREQGNAIGWDGAGYGEGVSLHEAAMNLANNDTRAVNNLLYNMKDSNDIYQQKVVEYLDKGYSIDSARRMAGQRSSENTASNLNQIRDAFRMYGMDERGAITPQGADILASLALNGQGELANFYANMLPKPEQNWSFDNSLITAANAQRDALERSRLSNALTMQRDAKNLEYDMTKSAYNHQLQRDDIMFRQQLKNSEQERAYNILVEAGYTPQEAALAVLGVSGGRNKGSGKASGGEGSEEKLSATQQERLNELSNKYNTAFKSGSAEDIAIYEEYAKSIRDKLSPDDAEILDYTILTLKGYEAKRRGDDDAAASFWSQIPAAYRETMIPNENFDGY